jgi:hypothetical protein
LNNLSEVLHREKFGGIIRVFSKNPAKVEKYGMQALNLARKATALRAGGKNVFSQVLIMIPEHEKRIDHDCGLMAPFILSQRKQDERNRIQVIPCPTDDLFCGVLNRGMSLLGNHGIRYRMVISGEASDYLDEDYMERSAEAILRGSLIVPMAITELQELVLKGRAQNTCCIWDGPELQAVGGFDHYAEQPWAPKKERGELFTEEHPVRWAEAAIDGQTWAYPHSGVEEILPAIRLHRIHGKIIAPIVPKGERIWTEPFDDEAKLRHLSKMYTKMLRQDVMAMQINAHPSLLELAVMDEYLHHEAA